MYVFKSIRDYRKKIYVKTFVLEKRHKISIKTLTLVRFVSRFKTYVDK